MNREKAEHAAKRDHALREYLRVLEEVGEDWEAGIIFQRQTSTIKGSYASHIRPARETAYHYFDHFSEPEQVRLKYPLDPDNPTADQYQAFEEFHKSVEILEAHFASMRGGT